jgi:hypothetical protein
MTEISRRAKRFRLKRQLFQNIIGSTPFLPITYTSERGEKFPLKRSGKHDRAKEQDDFTHEILKAPCLSSPVFEDPAPR